MLTMEQTDGQAVRLLERAEQLTARRRTRLLAGHAPEIRYNDQLAPFWQPGIQTRAAELEEGERRAFLDLCGASWLRDARPPGHAAGRTLILDLGGGTGKVVEWLPALLERSGRAVTYLYLDFSSHMREEARRRFAAVRDAFPADRLEARFLVADATRPLFSRTEWAAMRAAFWPIVTVCAGGTIGNFGTAESRNGAAQAAALQTFAHPADAALVTFLDAGKIRLSLDAYRAFGRTTGMYDAQDIRAYVRERGGAVREAGRLTVPFDGRFPAAAAEAGALVTRLGRRAFWLQLEMLRDGRPVGQVTRHYSPRHVRARFLAGATVRALKPAQRGLVAVFSHGPDPGR